MISASVVERLTMAVQKGNYCLHRKVLFTGVVENVTMAVQEGAAVGCVDVNSPSTFFNWTALHYAADKVPYN
jgi:hypothetical protein